MAKKAETNGVDTQLRTAAETLYAQELEALGTEDDWVRPANWRLSPRAVVTYVMGGKTRSGVEIAPKYIGNRRLIETAVATLATDRALLLLGVPGTAKSWVSEHLAAAITGSANLLVTVTCRTLEDLYHFVTAKVGALDAVRQADVVPVLHRLKQAGTRLHDGRLLPA